MPFKKLSPPTALPDSPDKLLRALPRRRIPDVLPHQQSVLSAYAREAVDAADVALQLPTGSGKTLVGLLIAEWRRRRDNLRVVYVCPTRQLVNQVVEQALEKYGLDVTGFVGTKKNYTPNAKSSYQSATTVAVTTYSSLFNTAPFFSDADLVILDDAHAAESYISSMWSLKVERGNEKHSLLHGALRNLLKDRLEPGNYARLCGGVEFPADRAWVDKIPGPILRELAPQLIEICDAHASASDLSHPWSLIRDRVVACQLYLSSSEITIRPLLPPTWTHLAFSNPQQRVYMSATLSAGGDLERITGRRTIKRLPIPVGWDLQGVGRRFFMFPGMSLLPSAVDSLRLHLMKRAGRSLVLVPSDGLRNHVVKSIAETISFPVFGAEQIENSKKPFVESAKAVAAVANRYDGIDFPGNECRLLFIEGLPTATNVQERFLMARMGANVLLNERVQARVLQAIGRCTRSLEDYSAVVVSGEELPDYLANVKRRRYLHPELQAELSFGIEQSRGVTEQDFRDYLDVFLLHGKEWEEADAQIVAERAVASQEQFPGVVN